MPFQDQIQNQNNTLDLRGSLDDIFIKKEKEAEKENQRIQKEILKNKRREFWQTPVSAFLKWNFEKEKKIFLKIKNSLADFWLKHNPCFKRLSFFNLSALFFIFCHEIGWTAIFLTRFIFFLLLEFFQPLIKILNQVPILGSRVPVPVFNELVLPKMNLNWQAGRSALAIGLFSTALILPAKGFNFYQNLSLNEKKEQVSDLSKQAFQNLSQAASLMLKFDFEKAGNNFEQAQNNLSIIQIEAEKFNDFLFKIASVIPQKDAQLIAQSKFLLVAGQAGAQAGETISKGLNDFWKNEKIDFRKAFIDFQASLQKTYQYTQEAQFNLEQINSKNIPSQYQANFNLIINKNKELNSGLGIALEYLNNFSDFLGISQDKRYLVVFQNNTEARASGGFIGSYALVDIKNGRIKKWEAPAGGSYDTEGGMHVSVAAPEPLQLVNPLWHFWDANWWPDWSSSANKLAWFYEKSGGPTVDGVISFTPTFFENFLSVFGSIDLPESGLTINADNFLELVQTEVERKDNLCKNKQISNCLAGPKKIISDLMEKIIEEFPQRFNKKMLAELVGALERGRDEKHVLVYLKEQKAEDKIKELGWAGEVKQTEWDYLMVVNTNIGGQKTDRAITQKINHIAKINQDGSITDTITVQRTHNGKKGETFTGVRNVDWLRIYVQKDSQLIEASGFKPVNEIYFEKPEKNWLKDEDLEEEVNAKIDQTNKVKIYNEAGKTVFAGWSQLDPGQTEEIKLTYRLPFKIVAPTKPENLENKIREKLKIEQKDLLPYALLIQKQPGSLNTSFYSRLECDPSFKTVWNYPANLNMKKNGWDQEVNLNTDNYWAVLMEK